MGCQFVTMQVFVSPTFGDTSAYMGPTILVVPTESRKLLRQGYYYYKAPVQANALEKLYWN